MDPKRYLKSLTFRDRKRRGDLDILFSLKLLPLWFYFPLRFPTSVTLRCRKSLDLSSVTTEIGVEVSGVSGAPCVK